MKEYTDNQPYIIASDEYLDLVNENDEITSRKLRSLIYLERLSNFRVVNAFVVNSEGQLWIPQRSYTKMLFPGALDFSMGGHVSSGESYVTAFERETREELGIDVALFNYRILGKLTPKRNRVSSFMQVYEIMMDQAPNYNPDDFIASYWIYPDELLPMIYNGIPVKEPDLRIAVESFYFSLPL